MKSILRFFFLSPAMSPGWQEFGWAVWRVFLGLSMALAHGWNKIPPSEGFTENIGNMGFPLPIVFAWLAALSEFVGGLLIAVGLFTRFAVVSLVITMGVAAFIAHAGDGFKVMEMALLFLVGSLPFFFAGPGRFSIDHVIRG